MAGITASIISDSISGKVASSLAHSKAKSYYLYLVARPRKSQIPNSQLDYSSTLTFPQGQPTQFQFVIKPKKNLIVPIWAANFILDSTSTIIIQKNGASADKFLARAVLTGKMSIHTGNGLKPLPNIDFDLMSFQGLQIQTREPYVKCDFFTMGLASPQKNDRC